MAGMEHEELEQRKQQKEIPTAKKVTVRITETLNQEPEFSLWL
jgi:hypothetical protein